MTSTSIIIFGGIILNEPVMIWIMRVTLAIYAKYEAQKESPAEAGERKEGYV
jgi:hypothetical protein